jgi:hypothetical protein
MDAFFATTASPAASHFTMTGQVVQDAVVYS